MNPRKMRLNIPGAFPTQAAGLGMPGFIMIYCWLQAGLCYVTTGRNKAHLANENRWKRNICLTTGKV